MSAPFSLKDIPDVPWRDIEPTRDLDLRNSAAATQEKNFSNVSLAQFGTVDLTVLFSSHGDQMSGIATAFIPTEMMQLFAGRDRPDQLLIHPAVEQERLSVVGDLPITELRLPAEGVPAACLGVDLIPRRGPQVVAQDKPRPFTADPSDWCRRIRRTSRWLSASTLAQTSREQIVHSAF